ASLEIAATSSSDARPFTRSACSTRNRGSLAVVMVIGIPPWNPRLQARKETDCCGAVGLRGSLKGLSGPRGFLPAGADAPAGAAGLPRTRPPSGGKRSADHLASSADP